MATATKDKLATLEGLKALKDGISIPSVSLQIPTGQWSGTGPYTYTVNVTNVTADTVVEAQLDNSINYLTGDLTVTSGAGKLTLSTTKLPTGTLNVTVFFPGVHSDVVVQVLADVYSKSQVDTKIAKRNLETYTSVTQLGLTSGSATILSAFNVLPDGSALYAQSDDFANGATPSNGLVEIVKRQNARAFIAFYSKNAQTHDYRMYEGPTTYNNQNANAPTGSWVRMWDAQAPIPIDGGGTGANTAAAARTALDVYSKGETVQVKVPYNGNVDDVRYTSLMYLNNATGTTTGGLTSQGQFHGQLLTVASATGDRAIQLHNPLWSTGVAIRQYTNTGWSDWTQLAKATPAIYSVRGAIVKSASTGTAVGYGKATVAFIGKTVRIDFEAKITTAGSVSNIYDVGIQVANLRAIESTLPTFNVGNGGNIHYYTTDGKMDIAHEGYAGEAAVNTSGNYWSFGRVHTQSGSVGAWADNIYDVGEFVTGTLYGVLP